MSTMRMYKTAKGFWGLGFTHSSGGWHLTIAKWVFTTEPE